MGERALIKVLGRIAASNVMSLRTLIGRNKDECQNSTDDAAGYTYKKSGTGEVLCFGSVLVSLCVEISFLV